MAKPSTRLTSKSCTLGLTLALARSWELTWDFGCRRRALEAGLFCWQLPVELLKALQVDMQAPSPTSAITHVLSQTPPHIPQQLPWSSMGSGCISTTTLALDRNDIIHYVVPIHLELCLHLSMSFWAAPRQTREQEVASMQSRDEGIRTTLSMLRTDQALIRPLLPTSVLYHRPWHISTAVSIEGQGSFLPHRKPTIPHAAAQQTLHMLKYITVRSPTTGRQQTEYIRQKIRWFSSTCKRQFDLIRDHTAVLLRNVLSCLNPGFHVIMQQGLRQHYHSCSGICHNSPLPSWGLGKNRRLSEIPPYTCFEKGGEKRGSLAGHNEKIQCCVPTLFYSLTSPVKAEEGECSCLSKLVAKLASFWGH